VVKPSQAPRYEGATIGLLVGYAIKCACHLSLLGKIIKTTHGEMENTNNVPKYICTCRTDVVTEFTAHRTRPPVTRRECEIRQNLRTKISDMSSKSSCWNLTIAGGTYDNGRNITSFVGMQHLCRIRNMQIEAVILILWLLLNEVILSATEFSDVT
jgi:hypothetical protein